MLYISPGFGEGIKKADFLSELARQTKLSEK